MNSMMSVVSDANAKGTTGWRRRVNVRGPLGRPDVPRRALTTVLSRIDTSFGPGNKGVKGGALRSVGYKR